MLRFSFVGIILIAFSCGHKSDPNIALTFNSTFSDSLSLKIFNDDGFKEDILLQSKTKGKTAINHQFEILKPTMALFEINGFKNVIYLESGFDLTVSDSPKGDYDIITSGTGSAINNLMNQVSARINKVKLSGLYDLNPNDFIVKCDSLEKSIQKMILVRLDRDGFTKSETQLINLFARVQLMLVRQEYGFQTYTSMLVDQIYKYKETGQAIEIQSPNQLHLSVQEVTLDTSLLELKMPGYKTLLYLYIKQEVDNALFEVANWNKPNHDFPQKAIKSIRDKKYLPAFEEYFIAIELRDWVKIQGVTSEIEALYSAFLSDYETSIYVDDLLALRNSLLREQPNVKSYSAPPSNEFDRFIGQKASDFSGFSLSGEKVSVHDFIGKVIYVDVWATWCAPCRDEFPSLRKLTSDFAANEDVVILTVSIDRNIDRWRNLIKNQPELATVSLIIGEPESITLFNKAYLITAIPRYFLINKSGEIVNANSPGPSSTEIRGEILRLL